MPGPLTDSAPAAPLRTPVPAEHRGKAGGRSETTTLTVLAAVLLTGIAFLPWRRPGTSDESGAGLSAGGGA
jgi:hypothetical protein